MDGPSAGQQRRIPQPTCIEDAIQCNGCDAMSCYAGNRVIAWKRMSPHAMLGGYCYSCSGRMPGKKMPSQCASCWKSR